MTEGLRRIGIIVEGNTERQLFENHRPWFQERGLEIKVAQANGRPRLIQEARSHLEVMRLKKCRYTFFLLDQDDDVCPPAAATQLQGVSKEPDTIICVTARELEAWFLADTVAVFKATGQRFAGTPTDELPKPAERLKELFHHSKRKSLTKMEMMRTISPHFALDRAAQGNRSAGRFLNKLQIASAR